MATAIEGRVEPGFDDAADRFFAKDGGRQAKDVEIILLSADCGRPFIVAGCGTNAGKLVDVRRMCSAEDALVLHLGQLIES